MPIIALGISPLPRMDSLAPTETPEASQETAVVRQQDPVLRYLNQEIQRSNAQMSAMTPQERLAVLPQSTIGE